MITTETSRRSIEQIEQPKSSRKPGNFYILRQDSIVGAGKEVKFGPGSISQNAWNEVTRTDKAKVRQMRDQVTALLGIERITEVPQLLDNPEMQQKARENAYELVGNMYGIEKKPAHTETGEEKIKRIERIEARVKGFGEIANGVVNRLAGPGGILSHAPVNLEIANIVKDTHDPVNLILITLDNKYSQRFRFEAKRKLVLMNLAAAIDQRERETGVDEKATELNQFLDNYVLSQTAKIGDTEDIFLHSVHDRDSFAVKSVTVLDPSQVSEVELSEGEKLTPLSQRRFQPNGHEIPVYINTRKKDAVAKVLKLLRKGKENPAVAVDDELGFMAVFSDRHDIGKFKRHLNRSAKAAGTMIDMFDTEDTLSGDTEHELGSIGSSTELRQDKSHIRMDGIMAEGIFHSHETYLNQLYQRGVAHEEFEARRLFDTGVVGLLFPTDIYPYNEDVMRDFTQRRIRQNIESTF